MLGIIMAGGQGTRLRPLTLHRPKPMIHVLTRPVIDFVKDAMISAGIENIVVTTGYKGALLEDHVMGWNDETITARVNQEHSPMGTAGSVGLLRDEIHGICVVGSGDSVASFDISELIQTHREQGAVVTMALWEVDDPTQFGIVGLSSTTSGDIQPDLKEGYIRAFKEKPTIDEAFSRVINAGLYILDESVIDMIPEGEKFDFSKDLFPIILQKGLPMYGKTIEGMWFDVGLPLEILNAHEALISHYDTLPFELRDGTLRDGGYCDASASIHGQTTRSVISNGVFVQHESFIEESYLMPNVHIGSNCHIQKSILGHGVVVGDDVSLVNCVVGDGVEIVTGTILQDQKIPLE